MSAKRPQTVNEIIFPFVISYNDNFIFLDDVRHPEDDLVAIEKKEGRAGDFSTGDRAVQRATYSNIFDAYFILGIIAIEGISYLIAVTERMKVADIGGRSIYKIVSTKFLSFRPISLWVKNAGTDQKPPFTEIQKFIESGLFYFSYDYPLTHTMQRQYAMSAEIADQPLWETADRNYFWNYYLMRHFIKRKLNDFVVPVIRGFVKLERNAVLPISLERMQVLIISKICCKRAGTRFNTRGVNDDGNVANFVETEQIVTVIGHNLSFVIVRGSVPIFWEQGLIKGKHEASLSRTKEATIPAFLKHFNQLLAKYESVHIVDLLEGKKREGIISNAFKEQVGLLPVEMANNISYMHWDFHEICGNSRYENIKLLLTHVEDKIKTFGFFHVNEQDQVVCKQVGAFRVNCLDCLDRTNVIQGSIAYWTIHSQLSSVGINETKFADSVTLFKLDSVFKNIWADNGDNISNSYAGTGAMKSAYTRTGQRTFQGMLDDTKKSIERVYQVNFKDGEKQEAIDMFLGNIEDDIQKELTLRPDERWVNCQMKFFESLYSLLHTKRIYLGTWNVNGTAPPSSNENVNFDPWICPEYPNRRDVDHDEIDLYVFAFQEIVPLNTNSIVDADESNMKQWAVLLLQAINAKRKQAKVILVGSVQLVGIAILVFVKETEVEDFRGFQIMKQKTAASGFAGNKGALTARFDYKDSSICCICVHLTAHQNKVTERMKDINDIYSKTRFSAHHTPTISDHDYQYWIGDFNFRIDCSYLETIARIKNKDLEFLLTQDQLKKQMTRGALFKDFVEAPILFNPTYKYDVGTDQYESSDAKRVPSWCDRILFYSKPQLYLKPLAYNSGDALYISDHKPVLGLFDFDAKKIDRELKAKIKQLLIAEANTLSEAALNVFEAPYEKFLLKYPEFKANAPPPRIPLPVNAQLVSVQQQENPRNSTSIMNNTNSSTNPFLNQPFPSVSTPDSSSSSTPTTTNRAILTAPSITASPNIIATTKRRDVKSLPPTPTVTMNGNSNSPSTVPNKTTTTSRRAFSVQVPTADIDDSVFSTPTKEKLSTPSISVSTPPLLPTRRKSNDAETTSANLAASQASGTQNPNQPPLSPKQARSISPTRPGTQTNQQPTAQSVAVPKVQQDISAILVVYSKIQLDGLEPGFGDKMQIMASINLLFGSLKQLLTLLQFYQSSQDAIFLTEWLIAQINRISLLAKDYIADISNRNKHEGVMLAFQDVKNNIQQSIPRIR